MYKLTNGTEIIRLADTAYIPADPMNADFENYMLWLQDGNSPEPADPPAPPPTPADKLASAGLSVDDLRDLLGL